jgi:hypothetical protein
LLVAGFTTSADFLATTFGSGLLDVTDTFFTGVFGVTAGLALALLTDFTAVLLAATVAFTGFLGAGLTIDLPAFETTLLVGLFAIFFAATCFDLTAGLAGVLATTFFAGALTAFFTTDFAGVLALFAEARDEAGLTALDLAALDLTVFLFVAMGSSTKWNCRCCKRNWSTGRADSSALLQAGHSPG